MRVCPVPSGHRIRYHQSVRDAWKRRVGRAIEFRDFENPEFPESQNLGNPPPRLERPGRELCVLPTDAMPSPCRRKCREGLRRARVVANDFWRTQDIARVLPYSMQTSNTSRTASKRFQNFQNPSPAQVCSFCCPLQYPLITQSCRMNRNEESEVGSWFSLVIR